MDPLRYMPDSYHTAKGFLATNPLYVPPKNWGLGDQISQELRHTEFCDEHLSGGGGQPALLAATCIFTPGLFPSEWHWSGGDMQNETTASAISVLFTTLAWSRVYLSSTVADRSKVEICTCTKQ